MLSQARFAFGESTTWRCTTLPGNLRSNFDSSPLMLGFLVLVGMRVLVQVVGWRVLVDSVPILSYDFALPRDESFLKFVVSTCTRQA